MQQETSKADSQVKASFLGRIIVADTSEPKPVRGRNLAWVSSVLTSKRPTVYEQKLYTGDYWLIGEQEEALIERKTLSDLENSFFNGRLDSEVAKMLSWRNKRQERVERLLRVRIMIEGSYVIAPIQLRLLTYQREGVEVIWGEEAGEMLRRQYLSVLKGQHRVPRVRQIDSVAKHLCLADRVLAPLLNTKQRALLHGRYHSLEEVVAVLVANPKALQMLPGFGPQTVKKLKEGLLWENY